MSWLGGREADVQPGGGARVWGVYSVCCILAENRLIYNMDESAGDMNVGSRPRWSASLAKTRGAPFLYSAGRCLILM